MNCRLSVWIVFVCALVALAGCDCFKVHSALTTDVPPTAAYVFNGDEVRYEGDVVRAGRDASSTDTLWYPGQHVTLRKGKVLNIDFKNFDAQSSVLVTEIDPVSNQAIMRVVRVSKLKLKFERECQTFRVGNLSTLPEVEISNTLPARQIVVTPLCDGKRNLIGYEYRYGSQADGCNAKQALLSYKQCSMPTATKTPKRGLSLEERLCIYFGICD